MKSSGEVSIDSISMYPEPVLDPISSIKLYSWVIPWEVDGMGLTQGSGTGGSGGGRGSGRVFLTGCAM